jgi:hypothetical protein
MMWMADRPFKISIHAISSRHISSTLHLQKESTWIQPH